MDCLYSVFLLACSRLKWKSNPAHKLTTEELTAYLSVCIVELHQVLLVCVTRYVVNVQRVLDRTVCWSVRCSALLWRSLLEKTLSRKVERAMAQTQVKNEL